MFFIEDEKTFQEKSLNTVHFIFESDELKN